MAEEAARHLELVGRRLGEVEDDRRDAGITTGKAERLAGGPARDGVGTTEPEGDLQDPEPALIRGDDQDLSGCHVAHCTLARAVDERVEMLLQAVADRNGSDLLFAPGAPPTVRIDGNLVRLGEESMTSDSATELARTLAGPRWDELQVRRELDFSFSFGESNRVRANLFYQRGTLAGALRFVPYQIPTLETLGAPLACHELIHRPNGLILVTGPTGAGKSTTVAAMIDRINRERPVHIITIEDPIEYVHRHHRAMVVQREVGSDTHDFAGALRSALREDPDVVQVGEMRDLETIAATLTMAETGHLVFATLHTNDTAQAIDRMVDVFPPQQQRQIQIQLSQTLAAVIHQRLVPRADGAGRVATFEVMLGTPAIRNLIKEGKSNQLRNVIATGSSFGMYTLEADLRRLVREGVISIETATAETIHPSELDARD